ncbi:MAG: hydrolase [Candidatus Altiarchaeales archaeon]|nr:MAG: hydrolase [Candidatus Altiarchaeales archaeon]RLI95006.1 MAG: hydrolase [Candidatus Altiarchaeales archaeon]HDO82663.1 isochorismatase family protein [Candidatus Altiarchaeales archaeon]HEX55312.1 isochorismatase family protein [Candidatus Altiarchaeales archaeon]
MLLDRENTLLIAIDIQERLSPHISNINEILPRIKKLLRVWRIFKLNILITEQEKLGETLGEIRDILWSNDIPVIRKTYFSCARDSKFLHELKRINPSQIVLIGIEAHICVLQTALDLIEEGYEVHIVLDAIGSRNENDKKVAIDKMTIAGAIPTTTEIIIYELLKSSRDEHFKEILKIVKEN